MSTAPIAVGPPLWRTSPLRVARLVVGLWAFGAGQALIVRSALGNSPWTMLAEGVSLHTPLSIGAATALAGLVIVVAWVPLRVRPGLGTLVNVALVGVALDVTLLVTPEPPAVAARAGLLAAGIAVVGLGSGLYLGTAHGPGPRDGLMTGLHRATHRPIALVRGLIEVSALAVGWALGGTLGIGTVAFAVLVGPAVQAGIALDRRIWRGDSPAPDPPAGP